MRSALMTIAKENFVYAITTCFGSLFATHARKKLKNVDETLQ